MSQTDNPDFLKEYKKEFDSLIVKGDSCFYEKNYQNALSFYENAINTEPMYMFDCSDTFCLKFKEELTTAIKKNNLIIELLWNEKLSNVSGDSVEKYNKYIKLGDEYLSENFNNLERSIQAYLRAANISPSEKYPLEQIKKITESFYKEKDTLEILSLVIMENCNYLLKPKKINEAENYLKNQHEFLNNYYVNKRSSLQDKNRIATGQLAVLQRNKTKNNKPSEINILEQQISSIAKQIALLESAHKLVLETFAKCTAHIQWLKTNK